MEALGLWRLLPSQIASDLQRYYRRHIREWHRHDFSMSSRELLELLGALPDSSGFKEATERTFRVARYCGNERPELKGKLLHMSALGDAPSDVEVVAEYVDWPFDRKLAARAVRELVAARVDGTGAQVDFSGLLEPLEMVLLQQQRAAQDAVRERAERHILAGLFGHERS
jgi:hypothetical protein